MWPASEDDVDSVGGGVEVTGLLVNVENSPSLLELRLRLSSVVPPDFLVDWLLLHGPAASQLGRCDCRRRSQGNWTPGECRETLRPLLELRLRLSSVVPPVSLVDWLLLHGPAASQWGRCDCRRRSRGNQESWWRTLRPTSPSVDVDLLVDVVGVLLLQHVAVNQWRRQRCLSLCSPESGDWVLLTYELDHSFRRCRSPRWRRWRKTLPLSLFPWPWRLSSPDWWAWSLLSPARPETELWVTVTRHPLSLLLNRGEADPCSVSQADRV